MSSRGSPGEPKERASIRASAGSTTYLLLSVFFLNALSMQLPGVPDPVWSFLVLAGLVAWSAVPFHSRVPRNRLLSPNGAVLGVALSFLAWTTSPLPQLAAGAVVVCTIGSLLSLETNSSALGRTMLHLGPLVFAIHVAFRFSESAASQLQEVVHAWSAQWGNTVLGQPLDIGLVPAGLFIAATLSAVLFSRYALVEWLPHRLIQGHLALALLHSIALTHPLWIPSQWETQLALTLAPHLFFWMTAPVTCWIATRPARGTTHCVPRNPRFAVAGGVLIAFPLILLSFTPVYFPGNQERVLFYSANEGPLLNWDKPERGRLGLGSAGMFGMLPELLAADGFEVGFLEGQLTSRNLQQTDCLVAINANTQWTDEELISAWKFVEGGGRLVVAGDHTGVMGTRESQNALLEPIGIRFNYDSALTHPTCGWSQAMLSNHPALSAISSASAIGIGTGASLAITGSARPWVVSRLGLSDLGDATNDDGAFLGDYTYQRGERLGDLTLIASETFGRGEVLVLGDTSPFQNVMLPTTYQGFVRPLFQWMTRSKSLELGDQRSLVASLLVIGFALLLCTWTPAPWKCAGTLGLIALVVFTGREFHQWRLDRAAAHHSRARIDLSHAPRVDFYRDGKNSIGNLSVQLLRNNRWLDYCQDYDVRDLGKGDVFLSIAPAVPYRHPEVDDLMAFARRGGLAIFACGYEHKAAIDTLLDRMGLDIAHKPLGSIPLYRPEGRVRTTVEYVNPWPIVFTGAPHPHSSNPAEDLVHTHQALSDPGQNLLLDMEPLRHRKTPPPDSILEPIAIQIAGSHRGIPLAVVYRIGQGGILLVADSYFFSSDNLSNSPPSTWNIRFLDQLLEEYERREAAS